MDDFELDALLKMIRTALYYETTAWALLDMAWVVDGPSADENAALGRFANLSQGGSDAAVKALALPWVADGVSDTEARVISTLGSIANASPAAAESVIALAWVADGVSDTEADFIRSLERIATYLDRKYGKSAEDVLATVESVIDLAWVADGVSGSEAKAISHLNFMVIHGAAEMVERVIALPWVADGVSDTETSAVYSLSRITYDDVDAAMRVMDMPFLQTLEGADAAALNSLGDMGADQLADMLSRPMLKDGVTDDEAPMVSMLDIVLRYAPDRVDRLLDPDAATVERRTVELPLAGDVDLVIVRTYLGVRRSMDLLENAVRESENLMGEPFPTQYVGLLFENAVPSHFGGVHVGTHMVIRPEFDMYDGSPRLIAHEVAHYYWRGSADWIDEGMAELMASAIENRRVGTPMNPMDITDVPCEFARSLKELEELAPRGGEPAHRCNYSLGRGLFVNLLRTLGEDAFWEGARNLYAASLDADFGAGVEVEEVRQAFGANVGVVIDRWYEGS